MNYFVGQKLKTKKPHACGCVEWEVKRVGADVKITCAKCAHSIFVLPDKLDKMLSPSFKISLNGGRDDVHGS